MKEGFAPVEAPDAKLLILGSLPGDKSIDKREYYAHPRNAFWYIMGNIFSFDPILSYKERIEKLQQNRISLWDVLRSSIRKGSLDSNISVPKANDISGFLEKSPGITTICCNGRTAHVFLKRYCPVVFEMGLSVILLPSTSPAAARLTWQEKLDVYKQAIIPVLTDS